MGLRHSARIVALQTLFELDFAAASPKLILERNLNERNLAGESAVFAANLVNGVIDNLAPIDETISRFATAFPVKQLAPIDRAILRLAVFEISFSKEVPAKVAVNEAIEIAKEFGSETSPRFINGVLGALMSSNQ